MGEFGGVSFNDGFQLKYPARLLYYGQKKGGVSFSEIYYLDLCIPRHHDKLNAWSCVHGAIFGAFIRLQLAKAIMLRGNIDFKCNAVAIGCVYC